MAVIRPFSALRPPADRATAVASVPYDVVNTDEARALAANNPLSFLHVSRPEIDLPDGTLGDLIEALQRLSRSHGVDWAIGHDAGDDEPLGFIRDGELDLELAEKMPLILQLFSGDFDF